MGLIKFKCYLSTPWSGPFREIRELIVDAIEEAGYVPIRLEYSAKPPGEQVRQSVQDADVVVADLTGGNPNVIYEVGLSHALRKPVLLLAQDFEATPAVLLHHLILKYDPQKPMELRALILAWFARATAWGGPTR